MEKMTILKIAERIPTEAAAYEFLEELRWHGNPVCPHCGSIAGHYFITPRNGISRETRTGKHSERRLWKCKDCRQPFSVLTGTVMHGTKIPVRTWVLVFFQMCASKNGVAAREVERTYGLAPKTAWFLLHRIREAMKREPMAGLLSGTVIADETYIGGTPHNKHRNQFTYGDEGQRAPLNDKVAVVSLLHAETGEVRSQVVAKVNRETIGAILEANTNENRTVLHTDNASVYRAFSWKYADHQSVNHSAGEYVRDGVSTNKVENFFGQLKRSIDGTHHHVSEAHLPRYLAEFDFRFTTREDTDTARMNRLMGKVAGRRLTYRPLTKGI
jgi:transposase-like protein